MNAVHERTNIMFPPDILLELRTLVPARERSAFVAEATRRQLLVLKQRLALKQSVGAWADADHSELSEAQDMIEYRRTRNQGWTTPRLQVADDRAEYHVPSGQ